MHLDAKLTKRLIAAGLFAGTGLGLASVAPSLEMAWVMGLLLLTVYLFAFEIVGVDVAAITIMVLLGITSLLAPLMGLEQGLIATTELFDGFASNAVMSIIAVMIIGAGLDKTGVMSKGQETPCPEITRTTSLHGHQAGRQVGEEAQEFVPTQALSHDGLAVRIHAMHLEHVLRDVQTNRANLLHGWLLLGGSSNDTANVAHRDAGGGAVHSINSGLSDGSLRMSAVPPTTDSFSEGSESPKCANFVDKVRKFRSVILSANLVQP